jgi:SAM-dependent methyltransferase
MGWMHRFRKLFAPLHTERRYYANYDHVRKLDLADLSIYASLKEATAGAQRTLDLGCGIGYVTAFLGAVGVDKNARVIEMARQAYPHAEFRAAEVEQLAGEGPVWDRVVCVNVLEHLDDAAREAFFRQIPFLLRPGGRFVAVYDSMYHPLQLLSGFLHPGMLLTDPTHVNCWTQRQFRRLLGTAFEIESERGGNILSRGLPWTNRFSTARLYVCRPKGRQA